MKKSRYTVTWTSAEREWRHPGHFDTSAAAKQFALDDCPIGATGFVILQNGAPRFRQSVPAHPFANKKPRLDYMERMLGELPSPKR